MVNLKRLSLICIAVMFLSILSMITYSAPPIKTIPSAEGEALLIIEPVSDMMFIENAPNRLNFHIFNASGFPLDNTTIQCKLHLYNNAGTHIAFNTSLPYSFGDWYFYVQNTTVSQSGVYPYLVWCNDSQRAGFLESYTVFDFSTHLHTPGSQRIELLTAPNYAPTLNVQGMSVNITMNSQANTTLINNFTYTTTVQNIINNSNITIGSGLDVTIKQNTTEEMRLNIDANSCSFSGAKMMLVWLFVVLGFILVILDATALHGAIMGILGSIMIVISSLYLFGCSQMYAVILLASGLISMIYFFFRE